MNKNELSLGIVTAPGITTRLSEKFKDNLKDILDEWFTNDNAWSINIVVDHITGAAENADKIMHQAIKIREDHEWDYVISLTDLPLFYEKSVVLSDINRQQCAAQVSLPAFGAFPTANKVKKTLVHITKELYFNQHTMENMELNQHGIGIKNKVTKEKSFQFIKNTFKFNTIERRELDEDENFSVRFLVQPKWTGKFKVLAGMTAANSPWSIMPSFKRVIGLAFATGCYMLIFNTLWQLSGLYGMPRFITLMITAMTAMVTWIIFAHNLWEKKQNYKSQKLRFMYNITTIMTLTISVMLFYISMFLLFSIAVIIFVPADIFKEVLNHDVTLLDYIKLAWLVTSAATVAGAIGAGLENEESVKQVTYGYRQYVRSKEIERLEAEQEKEESGKKK